MYGQYSKCEDFQETPTHILLGLYLWKVCVVCIKRRVVGSLGIVYIKDIHYMALSQDDLSGNKTIVAL